MRFRCFDKLDTLSDLMQDIADYFESILNNKVEDMRRTSNMKEFSTTDQIISQNKLRFQNILHRIIVCIIVKCD